MCRRDPDRSPARVGPQRRSLRTSSPSRARACPRRPGRRPRAPGCPRRSPPPSLPTAAPSGRGSRGRTRHSGLVLLLEPADPVLEPRRAEDRPRPRQGLGIALVREEGVTVVRRGRELRRDVAERVDVGDEPRLRAVREVRVRQEEDRRRYLSRSAQPRSPRRSTRPGSRLPPPAPVTPSFARTGPSGGRPARAWSASRSTARPLDVDDDERQLEGHGEPDRLRT